MAKVEDPGTDDEWVTEYVMDVADGILNDTKLKPLLQGCHRGRLKHGRRKSLKNTRLHCHWCPRCHWYPRCHWCPYCHQVSKHKERKTNQDPTLQKKQDCSLLKTSNQKNRRVLQKPCRLYRVHKSMQRNQPILNGNQEGTDDTEPATKAQDMPDAEKCIKKCKDSKRILIRQGKSDHSRNQKEHIAENKALQLDDKNGGKLVYEVQDVCSSIKQNTSLGAREPGQSNEGSGRSNGGPTGKLERNRREQQLNPGEGQPNARERQPNVEERQQNSRIEPPNAGEGLANIGGQPNVVEMQPNAEGRQPNSGIRQPNAGGGQPNAANADSNGQRQARTEQQHDSEQHQQQQPHQMEGQQEEVDTREQDTVLRDDMNFIQNVSRFFNDESLSDVIIKLGDERFFAHKFVLAKSSEVFMKMLYEQAWSQNVKEEIELQESPECIQVFDKFLRYMYTAEVHINTSSAVGILCLSDKYCVDSLKQLCVQYMIENSRSPRVPNALNWYPWAKALCLPSLLDQCMKTIAWNAQDIIISTEWENFDKEFISDIVSNSELVIRNEYSLLEQLVKWLLHESHVEYLESNCTELLPLIRFPMMQSSQLYQLEHCELSENTHCKELLQKLLSQAYRFRALCTSQPKLSSNFEDVFYHPRDYVELTVDNVRMQNSMRYGIQVDVKMYRGPVPQETKEGDWKITYRRTQSDVWQLQVYGHDTAMVNNEARVCMSVLIYNEQEKVIQVEQGPVSTVSRGNCITMTINIHEPGNARNMAVLIKPVTS